MNNSTPTLWSASQQRFLLINDAKTCAKKALTGVMLGLMATGAMAETVEIGGVTFDVVTDPTPLLMSSSTSSDLVINGEKHVNNKIYLNAPIHQDKNNRTLYLSEHTGAIGVMSLESINKIAATNQVAVVTGFEEGNPNKELFKDTVDLPFQNDTVISGTGYFQLGWAQGPKRHGQIQNLRMTDNAYAEILNGDFESKREITVNTPNKLGFVLKDNATLLVGKQFKVMEKSQASIEGGLTVKKDVFVFDDAELTVDGSLTADGRTVAVGTLTVNPGGELTLNTLGLTSNNRPKGTLVNEGTITLTGASTLGGKSTNKGTFTADTLTLNGANSLFTNEKTLSGKNLTISGVPNSNPAQDTHFVNRGDVRFETVTINGGDVLLETGTFAPADKLTLEGGTVTIGQDTGTDKAAFHAANISNNAMTAFVVKKTGTLFVDDGTVTTTDSQLYLAQALDLRQNGSLSVNNSTLVNGGSAHIGTDSVTTVDFAAIAAGDTPVLTTDKGTLTVDAGAKLKLINISQVNSAVAHYEVANGFTLENLDPAKTWTGGWDQVDGDNADFEYQLSWKDNPDDAESATLKDKTLYLVLKAKPGTGHYQDPNAAPGAFSDGPVSAEAIFNHGRAATNGMIGRSAILWHVETPEHDRALWVDGFGEDRKVGDGIGYQYRRFGVVVGTDRRVGDHDQGLLGIAGSMSRANGETTQAWAGTDFKLNAAGLYAYGAYRDDDQLINGHVGYVFQNNKMTHGAETATVKLRMLTMGATLSQRFEPKESYFVTPHLGFYLGWVLSSDYSIEANGATTANKTMKRMTLIDLPIGATFEAPKRNYKGWDVTPFADVTYTKPIGDTTLTVQDQGVVANPIVRNLSGASTGVSLGFTSKKPKYEFDARYRYSFGENKLREHALMLRMLKNF